MAEGTAERAKPAEGAATASCGILAFAFRYRVCLYLVAGVIVLDFVVASHRPLWRTYDPDEYRERLSNCRKRAPDLVVVGGSPVSEGIEPAVLRGLRWHGRPVERPYNLGLPGGTASEVWHAVEHGLAVPPRLLVYGVTASDLNDNRDEPEGPRQLMTLGDVASWARQRPHGFEWCARQFFWERVARVWSLYYYRNGIRLWAADRAERSCPGLFAEAAREAGEGRRRAAQLHGGDGYAPHPDEQLRSWARMKAAGARGQPFGFLKNFRLGEHLNHLHRLLDWGEEHGVTIVLVDMPVTADLEEGLHPREFAAYRAALAEVERERKVRMLHASRAAVGLGDDDFADMVHLNSRGTARFSAWLRRQLEE
jgi:hypothetical protein